MDEAKIQEIRQWPIKAEHDRRSARRLFTDEPPLLDTAAYHCQQAAEKALKAFLVHHDVCFEKTHLLLPLIEQCIDVDSGFESFRDAAEVLTPFATTFRSPGDVLEPDSTDVVEGLAWAEKLIARVSCRMPVEAREQ